MHTLSHQDLVNQALALDPSERERLVTVLINSLTGRNENEAMIETANRSLQEARSGQVELLDGESVFESLRSRSEA